MSAATSYAWIITRDYMPRGGCHGAVGPPEASAAAIEQVCCGDGVLFRLYDANELTRYVGRIAGQFDGSEPLDEFGRAHGCRTIRYEPPPPFDYGAQHWTEVDRNVPKCSPSTVTVPDGHNRERPGRAD